MRRPPSSAVSCLPGCGSVEQTSGCPSAACPPAKRLPAAPVGNVAPLGSVIPPVVEPPAPVERTGSGKGTSTKCSAGRTAGESAGPGPAREPAEAGPTGGPTGEPAAAGAEAPALDSRTGRRDGAGVGRRRRVDGVGGRPGQDRRDTESGDAGGQQAAGPGRQGDGRRRPRCRPPGSAQRSAGYHVGLQPSRTNDQTAVASTATAKADAGEPARPAGARGSVPPIPTRAPTAGASTTV